MGPYRGGWYCFESCVQTQFANTYAKARLSTFAFRMLTSTLSCSLPEKNSKPISFCLQVSLRHGEVEEFTKRV